jgi:acetylornithine deacetylase
MRQQEILQASVLDALQLLVRTPSVNPSLAPEEGCTEAAVAAAACQWLAAHGVRCTLEDAAPGRPNAVGEVGGGRGRTLIFCAHLDTVGTAGMTIPPFEPRREGQRVFGRGSCDMKGGAAAAMAAASELAAEGLAGRVLVALVADEEFASLGAQDFVNRHRADACVVTEPSAGRLVLAHKGFVWAEIVTHGRAAHGSRWDLGVSAIAAMGRVIAALEEFNAKELRARTHPLLGPASQHCAVVRGGAGLSTYAASCVLQVERRTLPGETPEQVIGELHRVISTTGDHAEVNLLLHRPPLICSHTSDVARCLREAAAHVKGQMPEEIGVGYWMDAAIFAAAGIPAINYGPDGSGAHEAVEWVDVDSAVECAEVLVETARRFTALPARGE